MKSTHLIGTIIVVVILVIAGLLVFRSTEPNGEEHSEFTMVETAAETVSPAGFTQEETPAESELVSSPETTDDETVQTGDVTITITEAGFDPQHVTVAVGTTVTFVNNGQALHWPASDVHPTHQILPEFDAKQGLATGETYSYTFDNTGTWTFHDHLSSTHTGTVTVVQ